MSDILLEAKNLKKYFNTPKGLLHAVDNVSFQIKKGTTLGLVGESGCGKSTIGRLLIRLLDATDGEVFYNGNNIIELDKNEMRELRKEMQIIFQDPYASLNPRMTVSQTIEEPIRRNKIIVNKKERFKRVLELMELVGLAERLMNAYPHELDGGRRQRIGIARALSVNTKFIVCDEPVSALDVSIQAQILNLLNNLQDELGLTYLFITHDLSVVNHFSDEIAVMYLGQIVEKARSEELFNRPIHPYTRALLSAIPRPTLKKNTDKIILRGEITSPINPKSNCRFSDRCIYSEEICEIEEPVLEQIAEDHFVACHFKDRWYS